MDRFGGATEDEIPRAKSTREAKRRGSNVIKEDSSCGRFLHSPTGEQDDFQSEIELCAD
jgi:hypothetical protein